jgi:GTPase SAR1 family protein
LSFRISVVIVGNKCDLPDDERIISTEEGKKMADKWRAAFIETSAKEDQVISILFIILY